MKLKIRIIHLVNTNTIVIPAAMLLVTISHTPCGVGGGWAYSLGFTSTQSSESISVCEASHPVRILLSAVFMQMVPRA